MLLLLCCAVMGINNLKADNLDLIAIEIDPYLVIRRIAAVRIVVIDIVSVSVQCDPVIALMTEE